ncbi:MAG: hypothetical protein AAF700_11515 [Pseudomonadota bacterium]
MDFGDYAMEILIVLLVLANVILAISLVVVSMARMDRAYAAKVRAEQERKSILRGDRRDRF